MNYTIETAKAAITGKAKTEVELKTQISALNFLCGTLSSKELTGYKNDVDAAANDLSNVWKNERISELLAMGDGVAMWTEFIIHREYKRARSSFNKKTNMYEYKDNGTGRINYPELNAAYIAAETARLEKEGKTAEVDLNTLTIAQDNRFNTYAPLFFNDLYASHRAGNLTKSNTVTAKGAPVEHKGPSNRQLMKDFNELVQLLLPDGVTPPMRKHELKTLAFSLNRSTQTEFKLNSIDFCLNWLLHVIKLRIEDQGVTVRVEAGSLDDVREREFKEDAKSPADDDAASTESK